MARIAGVDLPRNKHARIALTYIYGIGNSRSDSILSAAKVEPAKKVSDLNEDEVNRIRQVIEEGGDVRRYTGGIGRRLPGRIQRAPVGIRRRATTTAARGQAQ